MPKPSTKPFPENIKALTFTELYRWCQGVKGWASQFVLDFDPPAAIAQSSAVLDNLTVILRWTAAKKAWAYDIHRGTTGNFADADFLIRQLASKPSQTTYMWQDSQNPTTTARYYWITPVNERGVAGPKTPYMVVTAGLSSVAVGINASDTGSARSVVIGVGASGGSLDDVIAIGYQAVPEFNNEVVFGSPASSVDVFGFVAGANGQKFRVFALEQLMTIDAAAFTDSGISFPANGIAIAASTKVTVDIPTAATYTVGINGATTRYAGPQLATAVTAGYPGTDDGLRPYASTTAVRITPNAVPAANTGRVRLSIYYIAINPATS